MENNSYKNLSDEELVSLSNNGDELAITTLLSRYTSLVKQTARPFFLYGGEVEDLVQEGMLGLYKAVKSYNNQSSFKPYALLCIKRNILTAIKLASRDKHKILNGSLDFSSVEEDTADKYFGDSSFDPAEMFDERESREEFMQKLKGLLSDLEFEILKYYLEGYTYNEIANKIGKTFKSVDNAILRIRKKIIGAYSK